MIIEKAGIYDIDEEEYHADPVPAGSLSSSGAKLICNQTLKHFRYQQDNPNKSTPALNFGSAAHMKLLEAKRFRETYYVLQEGFSWTQTKNQKEWHDQANLALKTGKKLLTYSDNEKIAGMMESMSDHKEALSKFVTAPKEQSGFWFDKTFKIWRRMRLDWQPLSGRVFMDYKTISALDDNTINKSMYNFGWYQQAAWYLDGIKSLGLHDQPRFVFLLQEKTPPYDIVIRELDMQAIGFGRLRNAKAMDLFAEAQETGEWPGYPLEPRIAHLPRFGEISLEEEKEAGEMALTYRMQAPHFEEK
jgi:hypothetical protein